MSAEHDVFISYSAKNKAFADSVCFALEGRKIRCWIAPRDVRAGIPYAEALIEALDGCRIMVLLLSASSNTSPQVMREVERAASKGAYIIPVRIEDIALSPSLQFFIGPIHWIDALTPPIEQHLDYLAETVGYVLGRIAKGAPDLTPKEILAAPAPAIQAGPAPVPQASPIPAPVIPPTTAEGGSAIRKIETPPGTEVPPARPVPAAVQPSLEIAPARPAPAAVQASTDVPPAKPVPAAVQVSTDVLPARPVPEAAEKRRAALPVLPLMVGALLGVVLVALAGAGIYWMIKSHQGERVATPPPPSQTPVVLPFPGGTKPPAVPTAGPSLPEGEAPVRTTPDPSTPGTKAPGARTQPGTTPPVLTPAPTTQPATKATVVPTQPATTAPVAPTQPVTKPPVAPTTPVAKPPAPAPTPPTKPVTKPPVAPTQPAVKAPASPTPPAPKPPVLVQSVPAQLKLTSTSPTRVSAGGKVTLDLTFVLTANEPVPAEDNLAWRSPDGQLHYGASTKFTATPGVNTRHWTFTVGSSRTPGTEFPLFGVIRINGAEYRTQVPVLLRVAAAGLVDQLRLVPTSTTHISPGGKVTMDITFVFGGTESVAAEWNFAVRASDGTLSYMRYLNFTASPGPNRVPVIFTTTPARQPGDIPLVGVVRINGQLYHTQVPVLVTVAGALVDQLRLVPTSSTQISPGGKVTMDLTFVFGGRESVAAEWNLAVRAPDGTLSYMNYLSFTATPGLNKVPVVYSTTASKPPGDVPLIGVVRINGTVYQTQEVIPVQIVAR
jgi:cytoskeletal protein RodZ